VGQGSTSLDNFNKIEKKDLFNIANYLINPYHYGGDYKNDE